MTARDGGFTLVEALVSLLVFSLIAAGAVLMLTQSVQTQARVSQAQEALREVQTLRALLAGDLAQYAPRRVREADGRIRALFIGGDAEAPLSFVRAAAEPDGQGGTASALVLVEYVFEQGRIVRRSRTRLEAGAGEAMAERVLIADAGEAHFEFYDGLVWRRQWLAAHQGAPPPGAVALAFNSPRYGPMRIEVALGLSP